MVGILFGCATKPPEKPIVLRRPSVVHRVSRTASAKPVPPPPPAASDLPEGLTPEEKNSLFEDFDRYLARSKSQP